VTARLLGAALALGSVADWIAAIGTAGALIAAVVLLRDDRRARATDDADHRRAQAESIGTWITADDIGGYRLNLRNASDLPIYNATICCGTPSGHEPWTVETSWITVPPGETPTHAVDADASPTGAVIVYWTRFTDSAGVSWQREASGVLTGVPDLDYVGCS